jgi:hypothetical protein
MRELGQGWQISVSQGSFLQALTTTVRSNKAKIDAVMAENLLRISYPLSQKW